MLLDFKKYTVFKGLHDFFPIKFSFSQNNMLKFEAYFDHNCLYNFNDSDDFDINKLMGFSTTWWHHRQSIRVGWRPSKTESGKIDLLTYVYNNSKRLEEQLIFSVYPKEIFKITLIDSLDSFTFIGNKTMINDTSKIITIPKDILDYPFYYRLYPYFGGNKKAPHKMTLHIKIL